MKLINTNTLEIHEFIDVEHAPRYAILSHRWGGEECSFQMWNTPDIVKKKGYHKIMKCCEQAARQQLGWAWVDSCCIDKSSSAELTEAINSMYNWYKRAEICYAYLEDVRAIDELSKSSWFTRGWTLQELLAPKDVMFYNADWQELGTKAEMAADISAITRIAVNYVKGGWIGNASIAERLSWASRRQTTRIEDRAYSLLGICEVNMPLLYGEGQRSMRRLQDEIVRTSRDYSLLLWGIPDRIGNAADFIKWYSHRETYSYSLLPPELHSLRLPHGLVQIARWHMHPKMVTVGDGIEITLPTYRHKSFLLGALPFTIKSHPKCFFAIPLDENGDGSFARGGSLVLLEDSLD